MNLAEIAFKVKTATIKRSAGAFYADLLRNQALPYEELMALQWRRAQAMLGFAVTHTGFYGQWLSDHNLNPANIRTPEDWARIPVLERSTVKVGSARFLSDEASARTTRDALTGGSTGEPLRTKHDSRVPSLAHSWRMYSWWGVQPWDNLARIGRWGFGRRETLRNNISWWPTHQRYLDAGLISVESMRLFHEQIVRTRPALIEGYVGSMLEFADFLEREGRSIPVPVAVATTAAPLPESSRLRLQEVLGAPVYDEYRGSEVGWMAGECKEQNGLHLFADTRLIEVVGEDGTPLPPGESGDIVVTDLTNHVFPLIRYRLGDRGTMMADRCPCGVSLPLIRPPDGRTTDLLRLPSGKSMGHRLMGMFGYHPESVRLFQIHQSADYSITIRVVKGDEPDASTHIESAVQTLRERVGGEVPVRIEYVDALPFSGGKVKYVISDVPPPDASVPTG